ncbi:MAG TPA: amidohydrolase family protein [candidate division Zixibacteria bacterium]|nr:amidohydrolase family protein [candidate division Zixibacteria bacterium]
MTGLNERAFAAPWLIGPQGVIRDGVIALRDDIISYIGARGDYSGFATPEVFPDSVIFPGLINAHTHTDFPRDRTLKFQRGSMIDWVRAALEARAGCSDDERTADVRAALAQMRATATVAIAEVANDFLPLEPIVESGLVCRFFAERLGFPEALGPAVADDLRRELAEWRITLARLLEEHGRSAETVTLHSAPHAPYSTSAWLIRHLAAGELTTIHLAENAEEVELLQTGGGPWRERLRELGRDNPQWIHPGLTPLRYATALGIVRPATILTHMVHVSDTEIAELLNETHHVALCPRSNEFIGVGAAPVTAYFDRGVTVALGADSLGSNADHNLFAEMRALRALAPEVSPANIWRAATVNGAVALRLQRHLGRLSPGTAPGVFASAGAPLDLSDHEELFAFLIADGDRQLTRLADAKLL